MSFGYIPTCSDAEREARRRSVFGDEEPFDPNGWGLYELGKSSRSRRGWGKPTEPIDCNGSVWQRTWSDRGITWRRRNPRKHVMTLEEGLAKLEEDKNWTEEVIYDNGDVENPHVRIRKTRKKPNDGKVIPSWLQPNEGGDSQDAPPNLTSDVKNASEENASEGKEGKDFPTLRDDELCSDFERCSVHYGTTHTITDPDRCSDYWRHHDSCMWNQKCCFATTEPTKSIDGSFAVIDVPALFRHYFKDSKHSFYWAFCALKDSSSSCRWRLDVDPICDQQHSLYIKCLSQEIVSYDCENFDRALSKFKKLDDEEHPLEFVKEMWRAREIQQFSVKTHIDPRHFDDTEKIQFEEFKRSMEILFDGATVQWDHDPKSHSNPKDGSDTDSEATETAPFRMCRGQRGLLHLRIRMEVAKGNLPLKSKNHFHMLVHILNIGLLLAEKNNQLSNWIKTQQMDGIKEMKKQSLSRRHTENETVQKCLSLLIKEIPQVVMASLYTQTHGEMHVQWETAEGTVRSFVDNPKYFAERFQKVVDSGILEQTILDRAKLEEYTVYHKFHGSTLWEEISACNIQSKEKEKNSYVVSGAMPLFFVTRWPECYLDDNGIEELPGAYASKNMMVIKTTSETAEPGQIINRHAIGVLEIIKKIGKRAASCPEESMLSELDILKLEKIATTTAQVLSHSNLFANLGKKVLQMKVTSECFEALAMSGVIDNLQVSELQEYTKENKENIKEIMVEMESIEYSGAAKLPQVMMSALIVEMFKRLFQDVFKEIQAEKVYFFVVAIKRNMYRRNPHHNFENMFDVLQTAYVTLQLFKRKIHPLEQLAFFLAICCRSLGHLGITNYGLSTPIMVTWSLRNIVPKPILQNIAYKISVSLLQGPQSILAPFSAPDKKKLLHNIRTFIMATDQSSFLKESRGWVPEDLERLSWGDERKRLIVLKCFAYLLPKSYPCRPIPYAMDILMTKIQMEYCEQGYKMAENGVSVPPIFDANRCLDWPKNWLNFFSKKLLPTAQFLSKIDPDANIFENGLEKLLHYMRNNQMDIKRKLKFNRKTNLYPRYSSTTNA